MYTGGGGRRRHTAAEADLLRQEGMEWQTMELNSTDDIDGLMYGGCDHIGHKPYRPQPYRPQQKTISATRKINIGHNHIGHKIYGEFIWRHRVDSILLCFVYRPSPYREFEREPAH